MFFIVVYYRYTFIIIVVFTLETCVKIHSTSYEFYKIYSKSNFLLLLRNKIVQIYKDLCLQLVSSSSYATCLQDKSSIRKGGRYNALDFKVRYK